MRIVKQVLFAFQVPQSDHGVLQGRHGLPADVRPDQPAELPQRQELDEYVGLFRGVSFGRCGGDDAHVHQCRNTVVCLTGLFVRTCAVSRSAAG